MHGNLGVIKYEKIVKGLRITDYVGTRPTYKLKGLHQTISNQKGNTKISALVEELKRNSSFDVEEFLENSLVKDNKHLKLKLLEQKYRTYISNQ